MSAVCLTLLGQPGLNVVVAAGGLPQAYGLAPKDAALLAILALDGPTGRNRLCAWLWPNTATTQARGNLRQRLLVLRRRAGQNVVVGSDIIALAEGVESNQHEALLLLRRDPAARINPLLGSLEFAGCEDLEQWLHTTRQHWRDSCLRALQTTATALELQQRYDAALPYAQRLVREEPLDEGHHQLLMRVLVAMGNHGAAVAAFRRVSLLFMAELGIEPCAQTAALVGHSP
jgi:DNA-binding SARP family transcriptional activator